MAAKKTAKISLSSVKDSDGWAELGFELGFSEKKISKVFQWSEYADLEIEVDEDLNIVGGRIIPHHEL